MKNILTGKTNWQTLCQLSIGMTNPIDGHPAWKAGLVYVWVAGPGVSQEAGRWVDGGIVGDFIPNEMHQGDGSGYRGYSDLKKVVFQSASSGATLTAKKINGEWMLIFVGIDADEKPERAERGESWYYQDFFKSVDRSSIAVIEKGSLELWENK